MMQNTNTTGGCCFPSCGPAIDPMTVDRVVAAGEVCQSACTVPEAETGCELARAYMPVQTYRAGYCPSEAWHKGTLFPELYRPYTRKNCVSGYERRG